MAKDDGKRKGGKSGGVAVAALRGIPSISALLQEKAVCEASHGVPAPVATDAIRRVVARWRSRIARGGAAVAGDGVRKAIVDDCARDLDGVRLSRLGPVINATGVILNTNLGRSPLAGLIEDAAGTARGYSNLEINLEAGARGGRLASIYADLRTLSGAQAALVVNNNSAAVLLILAALSKEREVIVSRGELVQIGGGFRIPEIMAASGAILKEVGTTNRTTLSDYVKAVGPNTAMILKVHPSNFVQTGFVASVASDDLVPLAKRRRIPLVEDMGSATFAALPEMPNLPNPARPLAAGVDLVCFSGDKLFGGPQAGIILGRKKLIDEMAVHPIMRTLRIDKVTAALLAETLKRYLDGTWREIPIFEMLLTPMDVLRRRAARIIKMLPAGHKAVRALGDALFGGGTLPGERIPSLKIAVDTPMPAQEAQRRLRTMRKPIVATVEEGALVLDMRTISPDDDRTVGRSLASLLSGDEPRLG
jgi:L-seryl-tRNA(Ser) seleniumtransferase